jgi:hypothetical protein
MDRRQWLILGVTMLAGVVTSCDSFDASNDIAGRRFGILALIPEDHLRRLGDVYRAQVPQERTRAALRRLLRLNDLHRSLPWAESPLARKVLDEFVSGDTIIVDGWVLSVTEARACALFSLGAKAV